MADHMECRVDAALASSGLALPAHFKLSASIVAGKPTAVAHRDELLESGVRLYECLSGEVLGVDVPDGSAIQLDVKWAPVIDLP